MKMTDDQARELYALLALYAEDTEPATGPNDTLLVSELAEDLRVSTEGIPIKQQAIVGRVFGGVTRCHALVSTAASRAARQAS